MESLLSKAILLFREQFETIPEVYAYAPGRVNVIGEHIDYNDGYVLPIAIQIGTVVVGIRKEGRISKIVTDSKIPGEPNSFEVRVDEKYVDGMDIASVLPSWSNYLRGVLGLLPYESAAFNAVIVSNVPLGGGLSSSASFEISFCKFLEELNNRIIECGMQRALLCQKGDHKYVHVPCGIMDQAICSLGIKDNALLIDCETNSFSHVPIKFVDCQFIICDSKVRHSHAAGEYGKRKSECDDAKVILELKSWKDCTMEFLNSKKTLLFDTQYKRALHIVEEIKRTLDAVEAMKSDRPSDLGRLMEESHNSLRYNYEVSCKELDDIVESLKQFNGVYGSRMTGGGFGGYVVSLVKKSDSKEVIDYIKERTNGSQPIYVVEISDGCTSGVCKA